MPFPSPETRPALRHGPSTECLVRHDYKCAVYRALLSEFSPHIVREYFEKVPLTIDGQEVRGKSLYELLWKKKAMVPISWEVQTDNHLEEFLLSNGRTPKDMMGKILRVSGGSAPIPGKVVLSWFYPKVEALINRLDTRDICFGLISLVTENWLPGRIHRRVRRREIDGWIENLLVFIDDKQHRYFLNWDYEFIAGPQVVEAPAKLGMPPFEHFGMLADTRPPDRIARCGGGFPEQNGESFRIDDGSWGRIDSFASFCRSLELDLSQFNPPDVEVWVAERDYYCPFRKRIVLHQGCAYGAPFFISRTEHRKLNARKDDILGTLISDFDREEQEDESDALADKHRALLETLEESALFVFHADDESLSLNGRHFVKGIPAKIMRSLLLAHLQDGRTDFEYRDFKRDADISLGQKNSNFEVRLYRLMEKLAEQGTCVRLEKTGRGTFSLRVTGVVKFSEIALPIPNK